MNDRISALRNTRCVYLERNIRACRWLPRAGEGAVYPWPSLVKTQRTFRFYQNMINTIQAHSGVLGKFKKVIDIGQDRGESLMWLSTISENILGVDIDTRMIELSLTNVRMTKKYDMNQFDSFVLPEKSLIDIDDPRWHDVDLIKIDAGDKTLFVLEALSEVIERNRPMFFIVHSDDTDHDKIWDYLIKHHNYFADVMRCEKTQDHYPQGAMIAYVSIQEKEETRT